uniref:Uncharacterized protein n=1 Tax=Opuntia streptacantha TaxID=393608 RepID=A0A7C9EL23_OPUST
MGDGGALVREALNAPACEAIHMTEIETSIECDTFIPSVYAFMFQPWYSSFPLVENNVRFSFVTYVCVRSTMLNSCQNNGNGPSCSEFEVRDFSFFPRMILEKHEEFLYLRLVQDILSNGNLKDDRTETGTLSKFGC